MSQPSASQVHTDGTSDKPFKCVTCHAPMANWRNGYHCADCKVDKGYNPSQPRDDRGRWTDAGGSSNTIDGAGPSQSSGAGTANNGPRTIDNDRPSTPSGRGSSYLDRQGYPQGDHDADGVARPARVASPKPNLASGSRTYLDRLGIPQGRKPASDPSNPTGSRKAPARHPNWKGDRNVSTIDNPRVFKCSTGCGTPMEHWRDGTTCPSCTLEKAAAKPGAKPAAGGAKKPGGSVQDEFPKCPSCGQPTPDGTKCEDCKVAGEQERRTGELTYAQTHAQFQDQLADSEEESERRSIRARARAKMAEMLGLDKDDVKKAVQQLEDIEPMVLKSHGEKRYSFAPMYMPGRLDAHDEFVKSADELQEAAWEYVRKTGSDRTIFLQHIDRPAGEWVEIAAWPYAVEAPMRVGDQVRKAVLPAGTVYMGVIWEPWAYEMVKKGKLLGFSMGGWAKRVEAQLATDVQKALGNGEAWTERGLVNPDSPARFSAMDPYDHEATVRALGLD